MKRRHKRIAFIIAGLAGLGCAAYLAAQAFRSNLVFFYSPSEVVAKAAPVDRTFRVGGLVEKNTLKRDNDGLTVRFTVTDTAKSIPVVYKGILPDLFKEGKRSEEHTSELQSQSNLVCRLLLEKKNTT